MSAILGVFQLEGSPPAPECAQRMLRRMHRRGADASAVWSDAGALLGVARFDWESQPDFSGLPEVARSGTLAVVADASLYYRDDLRRRLGVSAVNLREPDSPSRLILLAYEKWGARCVEFLEGDFAFIIWDRAAQNVFCARDFSGQRPLFFAQRDETLIVASTIEGVRAHDLVSAELNLRAIAMDAAALHFSGGTDTCYRDVHVAAAGSALEYGSRGLQIRQWWDPIVEPGHSCSSIDEGATRLRELLGESVTQRMSRSGDTCVWLSGGRDSTAVFGAGSGALEQVGSKARLQPVSLRLSADDPMREDPFIEATAARWGADVAWVDIAALEPLVSSRRSADRDEPHRHLYESLMRRLTSASQAAGARVALHVNGGDSLFQVSPVILADLLASGRIPSLLREWRSLPVKSKRFREFVHWSLVPLFGPQMHSLVARIRGRALQGYFERPLPTWLASDFTSRHRLGEAARAGTPRATSGNRSAFEMRWFLTQPHFQRTAALCAGYALEGGVELRSPLLDARVVRFAASRPVSERRHRGESKLLLRRAMRGLLPDSVLAGRPFKTGTLATYFTRSLASLAPLIRAAFREPRLADLGIAEPGELRRVAEQYLSRGGTGYVAEQVLSALQCELWLKAKTGVPGLRASRLPRPQLKVAGST